MSNQPDTYQHALTTAFRSWHSLTIGAVLLAINVFLTFQANQLIITGQSLQGWFFNVIAGYAFIAAIYIGAAPLSHSVTLTESFPGIFDNFKTFIVGGLFYAIGTYLLSNPATTLQNNDQMIIGIVSLIFGGALILLTVVIGVAATFTRPKKQTA